MSEKYVHHPLDVVSVGDIVDVWVCGVDLERGTRFPQHGSRFDR